MRSKNSVDIIKAIACILIVGSHCVPLFGNDTLDFYYSNWFFRFSVPFFLIATGYFFAGMDKAKKSRYTKRIFVFYIISTLIYLPLLTRGSITKTIINILFGFSHLWYLIALAVGLLFVNWSYKLGSKRNWLMVLYPVGVLFNEYYKLLDIPFINTVAEKMSYIGGPRNAVFFAMPLLLAGDYLYNNNSRLISRRASMVLFIVLFSLGLIEVSVLKSLLGFELKLDLSVFSPLSAIPLFMYGVQTPSVITSEKSRFLRKVTDIVYIIHIWTLFAVVKLTGIEYCRRFVIVLLMSVIIAILFVYIARVVNSMKKADSGEAL